VTVFDPDDDVTTTDLGTIPPGPRDTADDFFCLRYRVWYPSQDCALRTKFRTSPGCLSCDQGRFNLKRHATLIRTIRWPLASGD
jgi:hypothetical protein